LVVFVQGSVVHSKSSGGSPASSVAAVGTGVSRVVGALQTGAREERGRDEHGHSGHDQAQQRPDRTTRKQARHHPLNVSRALVAIRTSRST
jgi:hypothetical protein